MISPSHRVQRAAGMVLALALAGCTSASGNQMLSSVRQPLVERSSHAIDLAAAPEGLAVHERQRLEDWFADLGLTYGDRVSVAGGSVAQSAAVAALATRHGATAGPSGTLASAELPAGYLRVTVERSSAHVPGCPDWSARSTAKLDNATSPGFGCAVNGNLAAMIADPEHLLAGAKGTGYTVVTSATKAIAAHREAEPTGVRGLREVSSQGGGE